MKKIILMITSVIIVALIGIKAILDRKKEEEKEILQPKKLLYGYPLFFKKKRRKKSSKYRNYSTRVRTKTKKKNDISISRWFVIKASKIKGQWQPHIYRNL